MEQPDRGRLRAFYDRLGAGQDREAWYEDAATAVLARHAAFERASAVFELGCGTGRFAAAMLGERLAPGARWDAVDLSPVMVDTARQRLAAFGGRARVTVTDGEPPLPAATAGFDRFVANYVFDLLDNPTTQAMLDEAARVLADDGLLCVAGLGPGRGPLSRLAAGAWTLAYRLAPLRVGGCRPVRVDARLAPGVWAVEHRSTVTASGLPSRVLVARRRPR